MTFAAYPIFTQVPTEIDFTRQDPRLCATCYNNVRFLFSPDSFRAHFDTQVASEEGDI